MHNAYFYDKDAKRVGTDKLTRYNSVSVAMSTTTIKGKAYYEVIENDKATGKFINADNIDGTKRTLKHNAYVYKSSKKRANKVVLKKGHTVVTTVVLTHSRTVSNTTRSVTRLTRLT